MNLEKLPWFCLMYNGFYMFHIYKVSYPKLLCNTTKTLNDFFLSLFFRQGARYFTKDTIRQIFCLGLTFVPLCQ